MPLQQSTDIVKTPIKSRKKNVLSQKRLQKLIEKAQKINSNPKSYIKAELDFSDLRIEQKKGALLL